MIEKHELSKPMLRRKFRAWLNSKNPAQQSWPINSLRV
jgi:hypothetical protein